MSLEQKLEQLASCGQKIKDLRAAADNGWSDEQRQEFDQHVEAYKGLEGEVETIKADEERKKQAAAILDAAENSGRSAENLIPTVEIDARGGQVKVDGPSRNLRQLALSAWMARGVQDPALADLANRQQALEAAKEIGLDIDPNNDKAQLRVRGLSTQESALPYRETNGLNYRRRTVADLEKVLEKRAMGSEQTNAGAEHVPDEAMAMLERALLMFGSVRSLSTVIKTQGAGPLPIPTTNDTDQLGEIVDENSATNEQDIATGQVVLGKFQYSSKLIRIHQSLIWDPQIDHLALAMSMAAERVARKQNLDFTVGAGTTEPRGATLDAVDSGIALATANTPTYAEMVKIAGALEPSYEGNATWMFHRDVLTGLQQIVSTTGSPIWQPSLVPGAPATILGRPYAINNQMPNAATGSAKCILYGDFSKYHIRDMRDAYMVRLVERYAEFNQQAVVLWQFSSGALVNAGTGPLIYAAGPAT